VTPTTQLILFHGVGDDGACWAPFLRALDLTGVQVITPNAAAHGGRRAAEGTTPDWRDQVREASALVTDCVDRAGGCPVVLGGHSMGAGIALAVAAQRPDSVAGLFLEDPPFFLGDSAAASRQTLSDTLYPWFLGLQTATLAQVIDTARADHPDWPVDEYEPWAAAKLAVDARAFEQPVNYIGARWQDWVRQVHAPVLVVAGETERGSILGDDVSLLLAAEPGWEVVRVPAGHDVRRDARASTVALLREFLVGLGTDKTVD
jgi:lipase